MSGAVVFAADDRDGEQAAVGVISAHHPPEGQSALTVVPVTAVADLAAAAAQWWQQLGVAGPGALAVVPRQRAQAGPDGDREQPAAALRAVLSVSAAEVSLAAGEDRLAQRQAGLRRSTADAVAELAWRRAHPDPAAAPGAGDVALVEAGRRLSEDFLAGPVGAALAARVGQAAGLNQVLELGLEVADQALGDLPWEALLVPGESGEIAEAGGSPLVLHRNVALYRLAGGPATGRARRVRGPLRLLVVIASPEAGGAELLEYEAELARIVAAVEPARKRGQAYVRVLNEGSLEAINAALREDPEGFHVLHLSCHARPGELLLETAGGQPDLVSAGRLLEEGVPAGPAWRWWCCRAARPGWRPARPGCTRTPPLPGRRPRVTWLLSSPARRARRSWPASPPSWSTPGVPQVLAMQAPVTDRYATMLGGEFYRRLATAASPDPLLVLAEARRAAERERLALPPDAPLRRRAEWATPALTAHALRVPLFNRSEPPGPGAAAAGPGAGRGRRGAGGRGLRRAAGRDAPGPPDAGRDSRPGLVLHGIGGVGKSTLAAEVLRSLGGDAGLVVSRAGQLSVDDVLGEVGARVHLAASAAEGGDHLARAGLQLRAADVEWADRWRLLAEQILPGLPVTVLLDNFEDNLARSRRRRLAGAGSGAGRVAGRVGAAARAEPARVHLPVPVRAARPGRAAAGRPAPGPAVGGRDQQADVAAARPGRPARWRIGTGPTATSAGTRAPWNTSMRCCAAGRPASMTWPSGWRTGCGTAASPTRPPGWPGPAGTWTPAWPRP